MNRYSIFNTVSEEDLSQLSGCINAETKLFGKNEIILRHTDKTESIGIIRKGLACLISISEDGGSSIIDYYERGTVFGKGFTPDSPVNLHYVLSKEDCEISFLPYDRLMNCCSKNCEMHRAVINSIIFNSFRRCQMHIDILSSRSIRGKLTTYFRYLKDQKGTDDLELPVSLSDMADYLSVDRSAMMREMKRMKEDGAICAKGSRIKLLRL